jgi:hypothetical protein
MKFRTVLSLNMIIVAFALLFTSCDIREPTVQSQSSMNINNKQIVLINQNVKNQSSSDANISHKKNVDYFAHLQSKHREVLQEWLKSKEYLRPAVEEVDNGMFQEKNYQDKENYQKNFEGNMRMLRESVGENGYQYYSVGDMNRDGKEDFAILLVDTRKQKEDVDHFALAIFNAPLRKGQSPSYYEENLYGITNSYIVFDKMIEKHLFLGKFESDVYCATYYPKGKTYYFKDCFDE